MPNKRNTPSTPAQLPKVSILIPIFNVEKYLHTCLDSVISQTLKDIEIICINDGSTDSSPKIIKEYAKNDPRFVIINKKNSGYGDSMNKGLAKATGEYIGIVESDDFIEPNMFEDLYRLAAKHNVEVVKSNFYYHYSDLSETSPQWSKKYGGVYDKNKRKLIRSQDEKSNIIPRKQANTVVDPRKKRGIFRQPPSVWAAIYKREFLEYNKIAFLPTPGASYQDTGFNFKVWSCARKAYFSDKAYLHYRQDNESSSVNNPGKVFSVVEEYDEIHKFLKKNQLTEEFGTLAQRTRYGAYMWNFRRLGSGLDADFLKHFSKEYNDANKTGALNWSHFDINDQRNLMEIIAQPQIFLNRKKAQEKAKVSVIVPVYNVGSYLEKCLDSLLGQSLRDIEIICIDDGSTDESINILEKYHKKDARIWVHTQKNGGQAIARNRGIALANSDFLMFCDSDDYYEPTMCEQMYQAIVKHDVDFVATDINVIYESSYSKSKYLQSDRGYYSLKYSGKVNITDRVIRQTDVSPCNKIFRSTIQKRYDITFPERVWYEDALFTHEYMMVSTSAYYMKNTHLYNYIRRDGSTMSLSAQKTANALDHMKIVHELFSFMKRYDIFERHTRLFTENYKAYYSFSRRHAPKESQSKLHGLVYDFLKKNRPYIDRVDPSIATEIKSLLPDSFLLTSKQSLRSKIKKPARRFIRKMSLRYRREQQIMDRIDALEKKIEKLSRTGS